MAMTANSKKYNVGGVLLDRPFKIRRLGHFGYNAVNMEANAHFYQDLLGFTVSAPAAGGGFFSRYGSDHHAMVIFNKQMIDERQLADPAHPRARHFRPENDINQITWQVQSVDEVWQATRYFKDLEMEVRTEGRAGNGSNFHLYVWDPDDQIDEFYYGIEQIGWNGHSKPEDMWHSIPMATMEPVPSEYAEVQSDLEKGLDPMSGYRHIDPIPAKYAVDGVMLGRPFKITRIGPLNLFVDDIQTTRDYYEDILGFTLTEEVTYHGEHCVFLRCDNEHHSLGLFPKSLRSTLGLKPDSSNVSFGLQLANYRQLKDAVSFLRENGVRVETDVIPPELHPGIDYAAYAFDPDGHCLELYFSMEQLGWEGNPRPASLRRKVDRHNWPDSIEAMSDTFSGEPFMGPWQ